MTGEEGKYQEWLSEFVRTTITGMEVQAHRRSTGSSYVPRKGDRRYDQGPVIG